MAQMDLAIEMENDSDSLFYFIILILLKFIFYKNKKESSLLKHFHNLKSTAELPHHAHSLQLHALFHSYPYISPYIQYFG